MVKINKAEKKTVENDEESGISEGLEKAMEKKEKETERQYEDRLFQMERFFAAEKEEQASPSQKRIKKYLETSTKVSGSLLVISAGIVSGILWGGYKALEFSIDNLLEKLLKVPKSNIGSFLDGLASKITGDNKSK